MLTRLYIDNFRCFVNFEYHPGRKQLILGPNGAGKSSLIDAMLILKEIAVGGALIDQALPHYHRTRWVTRTEQRFEIEATLGGQAYVYSLSLEKGSEPARSFIAHESLHLEQQPLLEFASGRVTLHSEFPSSEITYPLEPNRSSLASLPMQAPYDKLTLFRQWLNSVYCFRINPFTMLPMSEREDPGPKVNLSNFASWYRTMPLAHPKEFEAYRNSLREALEGFDVFRMQSPPGDSTGALFLEFSSQGQATLPYSLHELSEGQKCLVGLYAILHFVVSRGQTVFIDEPDNFISLREIQPWLNALSDAVDDGKGQAILISHHPELINQWAPDYGVEFFREANGPVRVRKFEGDSDSPLSPSELIARGWDNG